ncbi:MAG: uncharacterized membrane protein YraQ (UPF0718 family) [Congregibacter sp.]
MNKRVVLLIGMIFTLVISFWGDSRYPALDAKAMMGGSSQLEDPLSFEATIALQADHSFIKRVTITTYNWVNTNLQGMTFGLLLGAAFLSLINLIRERLQFKSAFLSTLVGIFTGAPLGVCVNCAAPIAKGMHDAGAKLETTLATLISSPTLNVVVVTMLFSLFPSYIAITKIAATFVLLLIFIPLMVHLIPKKSLARPANEKVSCLLSSPIIKNENWWQATKAVTIDYLSSLQYIVVKAVPLMLLAGFLGALVITLLPLENIVSWPVTILGVFAVAMIGVFLPVPIAFDIIVSATLLAAGMPMIYVMILLFTLGSFSIYSFAILWRSVSIAIACSLYLLVAIIGICTGLIANYYNEADLEDMMKILINEAQAAELPAHMLNVTLSKRALQSKSASSNTSKSFSLMEGKEIGLDLANNYSVADFIPPYYMGRGIAAGDYNNDGWQDIVVASKKGISFYQNHAGEKFSLQLMLNEQKNYFDSFVVSLVDINNDGWLDVYFTSLYKGNFYLLNQQGQFDFNKIHTTPTKNNILSYAVAFGDIDKDGDLDAVVGNWIFSLAKKSTPDIATNAIHTFEKGKFFETLMPGQSGETLSLLLSDYNMDGDLDLIVANDFDVPDFYYLGDGKGGFSEVTRQSRLIATSTDTTMSIDSADIDNDLDLEIYLAQISPGAPGRVTEIKSRDRLLYCDDFSEGAAKKTCLDNLKARNIIKYGSMHRAKHIAKCKIIADQNERQACMAITVIKTASRRQQPALCDLIPKSQVSTNTLCHNRFMSGDKISKATLAKNISITMNQNVLLQSDQQGNFVDQSQAFGIEQSAWSWNAKFADLDNDTWQDLYVVNGIWIREESVPTGLFFHNQYGKSFEDKTLDFGFEHYIIDTSYVYIDYDNDGDLDIIKTSINGPLFVYRNNESSNHAIKVSIQDEMGNYFGVGTKIIIHYGKDDSLHQLRELKLSGGYTSYDPLIAHFGLGMHQSISKIEVEWSTGEKSEFNGFFDAGQHYTITRKNVQK